MALEYSPELTVKELRAAGYSVIIWNPDEIGLADIGHLEDRAIESGNEYLASINGDSDGDEEPQ